MSDITDLKAAAAQVNDRSSFVAFLFALSKDKFTEDRIEAETPSPKYSSGARGWEHAGIASYLQAAAACEQAILDRGDVDPDENPWCACAHILLYGKTYE